MKILVDQDELRARERKERLYDLAFSIFLLVCGFLFLTITLHSV